MMKADGVDAPAGGGSRVSVTYLGGETIEGRLRRFDPGLADFTLQPAAGAESLRIRFSDVRWVAFLDAEDDAPATPPEATGREVTVRFFDASQMRGKLETAVRPGRGVFLTALDGFDAARVFVPLASLRDIVSVKPLGALLVEQGKATPEMVERALERQAELRGAPLGRVLLERRQVTAPQLAQALAAQQRRPGQRIGEVLMDLGFLSRDALKAALEVQSMLRGRRLGDLLTEMGFVDQRTVYMALAIQHYMPFHDDLPADAAMPSLLPAAFARRWQVLALSREPDLVTVAVSEAGNLELRDQLRRLLRVAVRDVLVVPERLAGAIEAAYGEIRIGT
jgi:hypothetical protein